MTKQKWLLGTLGVCLMLGVMVGQPLTAEARSTQPQKSLQVLGAKETTFVGHTVSRETAQPSKKYRTMRERLQKESHKTKAEETATTRPLSNAERVTIEKVLRVAQRYQGVPYRFGGTNPSGFDCSGYLGYVFRESIGMQLPRSADEQYLLGKSVGKSNLRPGDLVFFTTYAKGVSHSGIYVGNNKFISATSSSGVAVADMSQGYWHERYIGAKRIIG